MSPQLVKPRLAVIGAGFYGLSAAISALESEWDVVVFESRSSAMSAASEFNQARVHGGYHYPRSLITAMRSRKLYRKFLADYSSAVIENPLATYLIDKNSKVSSNQFRRISEVIGAPLLPLQPQVKQLINWNTVEAGFTVEESVFDSSKLRALLIEKINNRGGEIFYNTKIIGIHEGRDLVSLEFENEHQHSVFDAVAVCTYGFSRGFPGETSFDSDIEAEVCEMVIVDLPEELKQLSITVMDGPFWSITPFPMKNGHILSSVRHTPHQRFREPEAANSYLTNQRALKSRGGLMLLDSSKHVPIMRDLTVRSSLWGIKVIPTKRNHSDSRPIMVKKSGRIISILGSKLDNVYDAQNEVINFLKSL